MTNKRKEIEEMIDKAAKAHDAGQAVNFAQAACNAANAMRVLNEIENQIWAESSGE